MDTSRIPILTSRDNTLFGTPETYGMLARVSKETARKLFDIGVSLVVTTCNYAPVTSWSQCIHVKKGNYVNNFNQYINAFEVANCSSEAGRYATYWIRYRNYVEYPTYSGKYVASL